MLNRTLQKSAQTIADHAFAQKRATDAASHADDASSLSLSEALAAFHARASDAQRSRNGRELTLFEARPEKVERLIDLLIEGNYRDTAGAIAGITSRSIRSWMRLAEEGDDRYQAFAEVVTVAEALAESAAVRKVRAAGHDPRFWAAEMTYLERRHPDRWGRRNEESTTPKVVVQIGVRDSDVQVHVSPAEP